MARYSWAWAAVATFAATATASDPLDGVRPPDRGTGTVKADDPAPVPDVVIPAADGLHPRRSAPPPICEPPARPAPGVWPPGTAPVPGMATPPGTTNPPPDPTADPGATARAPEAGTQPASALNPNMFGDQLTGSSRSLLSQQVTFSLLAGNDPATYARYQANVNANRFTPHQNFTDQFPAIVSINGQTVVVGGPAFASRQPIGSVQNRAPINSLLENAQVTAALRAVAPRGSVRYLEGFAIERPESGILITPHEISLTYDLNALGLPLILPVDRVGRTKLSDDNSPLPRDRYILNYDHYANAALADGLDIHRTLIGTEMTFLDRQASVEFRVPFASTMNNVGSSGTLAGRDVEFGDVYAAIKGLWYQSPELNASAGLAFSIPTAADSVLNNADGSERVRIKNETVLAAPFVAFLYTPGERFFAQVWVQGSVDLTGNPVITNFDRGGPRETGRLRDQSRVSGDVQVGYWVYRQSSGDGLRGLAPFFELHYNTTISDASRAQTAPTTIIGGSDNRFDEVNATVGLTALFGSNLMVMTGLVVPLREGVDRFFDYQFGVRASWFFGPTARAREQADASRARPEALPAQLPAPAVVQTGAAEDAPLPLPATAITAAPPVYGCGNTFTPGFFGDVVILSATQGFTRLAASPAYHGTKPTDRDGPRLSDRFYFGYDRINGVVAQDNPPRQPQQRLTRQIVGFETTFEDRVSVGLRVPFLQQDGDTDAAELREIGDLTAVFKYALVNDPGNGNTCTIGLNLTFPTGGRGDSLAGGLPLPRALFAQPWVGAVWNAGDLFLQGTSSILLPTNPAYPVALFNSVGGGYWVYRDHLDTVLHGIAPVVEFHASNPINNRGAEEDLLLRTQVNMTTGLFLQFSRLSAGAAVSFPLTSPRPYDVGGLFTVSYQF